MEAFQYSDLNLPERILLGPGPSMVPPRVLLAMAQPVVGHLDPNFIAVMADVQQLLRAVFQTENELTIAISGTGSAGMEAALANFIEPGDRVLVPVMGYFGERLYEMAARYGAHAERLEYPWGQICEPDEIAARLQQKAYKLVALVHAETSTGARQPGIEYIAEAAHRQGTLVVVDTVASLGGLPVTVDAWEADIVYSGSQKCLSAPPGLAPITVSPRAWDALQKRTATLSNWYLDLRLLYQYWGSTHKYHHTAPVNLNYALREALRLVVEEGLEARFDRHARNAKMLWRGLETLNLPLLIKPDHRLPSLSTPQLGPVIDDLAIRRQLLQDFNIEIAGGFGPLQGLIWRIGLMGYSSRHENITLLLAALNEILNR